MMDLDVENVDPAEYLEVSEKWICELDYEIWRFTQKKIENYEICLRVWEEMQSVEKEIEELLMTQGVSEAVKQNKEVLGEILEEKEKFLKVFEKCVRRTGRKCVRKMSVGIEKKMKRVYFV